MEFKRILRIAHVQVLDLVLSLCLALSSSELWNPVLTSVSDGFNPVHVCMEEKGMVFLRGEIRAHALN